MHQPVHRLGPIDQIERKQHPQQTPSPAPVNESPPTIDHQQTEPPIIHQKVPTKIRQTRRVKPHPREHQPQKHHSNQQPGHQSTQDQELLAR